MKRGATALPVTSKVVKRHFWNGKGYATATAAYRAKAKAELLEMVLGPWEEVHVPGSGLPFETDGYSYSRLANGYPIAPEGEEERFLPGSEECKAHVAARFALFFPHVSEPDSLERGCGMVGENPPWNFQCHTDEGGDYRFESCKWAQEKWIRRRVAEMRAGEVTGG